MELMGEKPGLRLGCDKKQQYEQDNNTRREGNARGTKAVAAQFYAPSIYNACTQHYKPLDAVHTACECPRPGPAGERGDFPSMLSECDNA